MSPKPRRVAVVVNAAAGALIGRAGTEGELPALFEQAGLEAVFIPPDAGTLPEQVARAIAEGADAVVAAGGDGTVACTAQALAGTGTPMGVLPFGTMNLFAKDLGLPVGDTAAAVAVLAGFRTITVDIGEVNGAVFLCGSMLGLPARLGRYREQARGGGSAVLGWVRLLRAGLRGLARGRPLRVVLRLDGTQLRLVTPSLTITPNALDGDRLGGRTRLDGGELAIYAVRTPRGADLPRLALGLLMGRWRQDEAVSEHRARRVVVGARGAAMRVMNDGEALLLAPPLRYRIRPAALRVIVAEARA